MTRSHPRTSITHPLAIAEIAAGEGLGKIGITFCPGKQQPAAATGSWARSLTLDADAIAAWGAAAVVTLIEDHELVSLNVERLGDAIEARHMDWLHLPIRDVSTPDPEFEQEWRVTGVALRARLRSGFNVLVHCKGGLGRAGMIAARLLIDLGWAPEAALSAVRKVRPGAVETMPQERYVLALAPLPEPSPDSSPAGVANRSLGTLLGLAVGDAVGTTLEFTRRDAGPRVTDMIGGGPFGLTPGQWTDDTAMALALADSLAADPLLNEHDLMDRFVAWYRHGTYSCTGRCFDIGVTTRQALARYQASGNPVAGSTDPMSAGNGSLMRLSPVAIRHWRDPVALAGVAARQSMTTHGATEAVDACVAFATLLAAAISGAPRDLVLATVHAGRSPAVAIITSGSWHGKPRSAISSCGYVIHSLEAALWCVGRTSDFRSAVLLAANLGDDADTVAAITGQLAGALYGASGIPEAWLDKLAWRDRLTDGATALLA